MDGDGQSMLAIVQSLREAGLVVTVVDGSYGGNSATAVLAVNACSRHHERRSLGINTKFKSTQHSSTQANDLRYAVMNQLENGVRKRDSPSIHLPEFPPQRAAPHLTEGNFVVPGWRTSECHTPVRSRRSCRGYLHWTDRVGSVYRSEDTSAFAHSLRKYPTLTPTRSLSTELVQRLLSYTQNKSISKMSYYTNSAYATNPLPTTKPKKPEKSSKNVQTYTRAKPERNYKIINTPYEISYQGNAREKSRNSGRDKHPSITYDYLKKTKPRGWNTRGTEVRYLTDVTKCIKDAIRNICEEDPAMCPRVQNRYNHHRRMHHLQTNGQSTSTNKRGEAPASSDAKGPCSAVRCGPSNDDYPKIRTRYNQHKKHQHGGQKSSTDLNNIEIQACPPPLMREASVMTKSESSAALPHMYPVSVKTCCFCERPLPCHCMSETDGKIQNEVFDWIKEIPVYSDDTKDNKYLRCMLSKKLVENLQKLTRDGDFDKIREEIEKCLNVLPMWCPENDKEKTIFRNQMAENLMIKLKQFVEIDLFKETITSWFSKLPFIDQIKPDDREKNIDTLVNKLKSLEGFPNDSAYEKALQNEIVKVLNDISGMDKDVTLMANKLADKLVHLDPKAKPQDNEVHKKVCEWIDNTSEFTKNSMYVKDNIKIINDLSKRLTELQQTGSDDEEEVKKIIIKHIEDWLQMIYNNKNILLDIKTKNKLAQKLIDSLYPTKLNILSNLYVQSIFYWLKDTPELSKFLTEDIFVAKLAEEMQELKIKGYDDNTLLKVIEDWINQLCIKHGIDIELKVIKELAEKLIDKLNRNPRKVAKKFQPTISEEVSRILENESMSLNSKVKNNLQNKITNILSNSIENILSNETSKAQRDLIKLLQHEGNMTPEEAKDLADTVIKYSKTIPVTEERKKSPTKHNIKKEGDELWETDTDRKENLEATHFNLLPDEMIRGTKVMKLKDNDYNALDEIDVPDTLSDVVSPILTKETREMSLEPIRQDFTKSSISQHRSIVSTPRQNRIKQNVEKTVFDYIDDVLLVHSPSNKENIRASAKAFIDHVSLLLQNNDGKESVINEIQRFLNGVPVLSDTTRKELIDELTRRLLRPGSGPGFQTSTPRKDFSFEPRRLTFDTSAPTVHYDDNSFEKQRQIPQEDRYRKELTKVVNDWLDRRPLTLNENESKRFKEIVINDLVSDIIDRQKYLQLNAGVKSSEVQELENLKYQVFRWLNKVMDTYDFDTVMPQTEALMNAVREIAVPELGKPKGIREYVKKSEGQIPNYLDALQDEISIWVDNVPKHLLKSSDKKYHDQIINDLAKKLQVDSENVDAVIKKWLQIFFRYSDQDDINKVAQNLKKKLTSKGFCKEISWMLVQDSSEFIEENLYGGIIDWLKVSPVYLSANPQDRNIQENIVVDLAKGIKNAFENALTTSQNVNTDELFIDEIVQHLQKIPVDANKKSDPNSLRNIAGNLLQHLKDLQMFQNISARRTTINDTLDNKVEEWINSLPIIDKQNFSQTNEFEAMTKQFKQNLKHLQGDEKRLRQEIKNQLKILPVDPVKINDEKFVDNKVAHLLSGIQNSKTDEVSGSRYEDILLDIDSSFGSRHSDKRAADILSQNISKFCDSLLIEIAKLPADSASTKTMKQNIASKLKNRIEELNMNPKAISDDFLYTHILEDELDKLISISQPNTKTAGTFNELKKDFISKVKEAKNNAKSEQAGQIYKQQLRETVSKTLPTPEDMSAEESTSFEVVKDKVADAFINLHFYGNNPEEREKYKNKITKEISTFCNDYLKKHPSTPIDNEELSKQLYERLQNVSFSTEDSIREEVEETRIQDLITDYVRELPLNQETPADKLQAYKVTSIMSKRLHELEKEKETCEDYEGTLKNEIMKWTKKLPLKHWRIEEISDFAEKIINKLKRTEASRKFDPTIIDTSDFNQTQQPMTPTQKSHDQGRTAQLTGSLTPRLPPSTLTSEDRDHLQRIRERSVSRRRPGNSPIRKDAAISPPPIDAESQTEIRPWEDHLSVSKSPSIQAATQIDEAPHVCQSPTCGLRRHRLCLLSERPFSPISPLSQKIYNKQYEYPKQGQRKRLLFHDSTEPEADPLELRSSSCECQPRFIPYNVSPGRSCAVPRTCVPLQKPAPKVFEPFQYNTPDQFPATAKRQKRRDQYLSRREERPRKTVRPQPGCQASWEAAQTCSKRPESHEQTYGIRHLREGPFCGTSYRREVLISDDECEEQATKENYKCGCKERGLSNMYGNDRGTTCKGECIKRCPKCCGIHCPHPTRLYFRN